MTKTCIIIGASHAGSQCAVSLRQSGWDGEITLLGNEAELPYHRPPLSKDFLSGNKSLENILLRPGATYETANIQVKLNCQVQSLNRGEKTITTDTGDTLAYDKLVLATGARVRRLPIQGAEHDGVFYLRDAADVKAIKASAATAKRAVIIGGGYIGLETAASLRKQGLDVTLLEAADRILQRVTAPIMSAFYKRIHTEEGVSIIESAIAAEISKETDSLMVHIKSGQAFPADMIIIGIGVIPNTELAKDAGLDTSNGIAVNAYCQTSDPDIYAIGDVTWHHNPIYDMHLRLESVPNATEQAKTAALHMSGTEKPYNSLPWFWSDQYDLKLQIAGLSKGYDDIVIRGDNENSRSFAAFYFNGSQLLAVDAVNAPREFAMTRMLLTQGKSLDKDKLADLSVDLKELVQ